MEVKNILQQTKEIWGEEKLPLAQMIIRLGKVYGDICRWERNAVKDSNMHNDEELKKEFGNLITASVKFCDELGYDPEECVKLALDCQKKYVAEGNK